MFIDAFTNPGLRHPGRPVLLRPDETLSYAAFDSRIQAYRRTIRDEGPAPGTVVALSVSSDAQHIALLLALLAESCIVALLPAATPDEALRLRVCRATEKVHPGSDGAVLRHALPGGGVHPHFGTLRSLHHPGLVLFTTGSTGEPKAAVHDFTRLTRKYTRPGKDLRTLLFFSLDHIAGLDTLFYGLSNGSTLVVPASRASEDVAAAVAAHGVEVLPVSPTFLTRLFWSEAHRRYDLSSLRVVTFGAEMMPPGLFEKCRETWPDVRLRHKYGTTETGALPVRPAPDDPLALHMDGPGFEARVIDGQLHIRAETTMLGYLNAPDPFTPDGWYETGDLAEVHGGACRILGRAEAVFNVGGDLVNPARVEAVLREMPGILEASVYPRPNLLLGNIVCADVYLSWIEDDKKLKLRIHEYCRSRLPAAHIPIDVHPFEGLPVSHRDKTLLPSLRGEPGVRFEADDDV